MYVFSFRTIESLLTMAEVDIICDASQQAHAKLNGAEALLAATGALSEATADVTLRRCKAKKAASDASPVLHATRPGVPKWMRRHILCEEDAEGCYPCRLAPVMSVTVVRYLNLRAQCLHIQANKEDAHAHFDESVRVLGLVTERLRRCEEDTFEHKRNLLETLYLQTECHGRDFLWSKCREILGKQRSILESIPRRRLDLVPSLAVMFREQAMQVQVAIERDEAEKEKGCGGGQDLLESGLAGLSLNLNPVVAGAHAQQSGAELAKTPVAAARSTRAKAAPKKPVKRVMPLLRDK